MVCDKLDLVLPETMTISYFLDMNNALTEFLPTSTILNAYIDSGLLEKGVQKY